MLRPLAEKRSKKIFVYSKISVLVCISNYYVKQKFTLLENSLFALLPPFTIPLSIYLSLIQLRSHIFFCKGSLGLKATNCAWFWGKTTENMLTPHWKILGPKRKLKPQEPFFFKEAVQTTEPSCYQKKQKNNLDQNFRGCCQSMC